MNKRPLLLTPTALASLGCLVFAASVLGCGNDTSLDAKSAHDTGKGTVRVYDATFDQAWSAAHAAIRWNEVGAPTDHPDARYLITSPAKFDQIGIWLVPQGADMTQVSVVLIDDPNLPGPNEESVQKDVQSAIGLVKAGQPTDKRPKAN